MSHLSLVEDDDFYGAFNDPVDSAKPLEAVGYGLAALSIGLGLTELLAGKSLARRLGVPGKSWLIRGFGMRELALGASLIARPRASRNAWGRVAGDLVDMGALAAALRAPGARKQVVFAGMAFVGAALIADALAGAAMRTEEKNGPR